VPYFLGPEGRVALEGYCVLQQAIQRAGVVGIGRVVLNGKEKLLVLRPAGNGLIFTTLRSKAEVRTPQSVFDELIAPRLDQEQLQLAQRLIAQKTGALDQAAFVDRYQTALVDLIQTKIKGADPVLSSSDPASNVVSLMDALRQSLDTAPKAVKARSSRRKIAA
jgi:DNA end-binding protein Ku